MGRAHDMTLGNKTHFLVTCKFELFNDFCGSRRFVNFPNFNSPVFA
jgi:hypothetical protein